MTTSTSTSFARRIETDRKRAELRATFDCNLVTLKAKAKAEVEVAEAKKRMLLEEAKLDAEERLCEKSRDSSSVTSFKFKTGFIVTKNEFLCKPRFNGKNLRNNADDVWPYDGDTYAGRVPIETEPKVLFPAVARSKDPPMASTGALGELSKQSNLNHVSVFEVYLERQRRKEYINLATQIAYDGYNIAYVFYENQIRKLMSESPNVERRLEVLRASCVGEPREMVNLFLAPMKSISTEERIEKTLTRLRD